MNYESVPGFHLWRIFPSKYYKIVANGLFSSAILLQSICYPFAIRLLSVLLSFCEPVSTLYWSSIIHAGETKVLQDDIRLKDVFSRRWYILLLFSIFSMHSCAIWNTWGPIAETAKQVREQYRDGNL